MAIRDTEVSNKEIEDYLICLQQLKKLVERGSSKSDGYILRYSYARREVYLSYQNTDSVRFVDLMLGDVDEDHVFQDSVELLREVPSLTDVYGGRLEQLTPDEREELVVGIISPAIGRSSYDAECRSYLTDQIMSLDPSGSLMRESLCCAIQTQLIYPSDVRRLLDHHYPISPGNDAWLVDEIYRLTESHGPAYVSGLVSDKQLIYDYKDDFYVELMRRHLSEPLADKLIQSLIGEGWSLSSDQERARKSLFRKFWRPAAREKWIYEEPFLKNYFCTGQLFRHQNAFMNRITRIAKEQPEHRELVHRFIDWAVEYKA